MTRLERAAMDHLLDVLLAEREEKQARARLAAVTRWSAKNPDRFDADELTRLTAEHEAALAGLRAARARELAGRK